MMRISHSLTAKIMVPSALGFAAIIVVALAFVTGRFQETVETSVERQVLAVQSTITSKLALVHRVRSEMVRGGMESLRSESAREGAPRIRGRAEVAGREVPDLRLGRTSQVMRFDVVDATTALVGGTATLFVKDGADFVRVSTNVVKGDGSRAVGTILNPGGRAYAAITAGSAYHGIVDILGSQYLTSYEPMTDGDGELIGIWYVGYKLSEMDEVYRAIAAQNILDDGFYALVDDAGEIVAAPEHIDADRFASVLDSEDWIVTAQPVEEWGYEVLAAYPRADLAARVAPVRRSILFFGAVVFLILLGVLYACLRVVVLRPVGALDRASMRVSEGDYSVVADVDTRDELGRLAGGFNAMVHSVDAQSRSLRTTINTVEAINEEPEIEGALTILLTAAKDAIGARYAAVSVFGDDGDVENFISLGMSDVDQRRIGHLPMGEGLLGHVQRQRATLRLDDMGEHPAAVGFPPGHPPMKSLLAMPIVYEGSAIGNIYLSDKEAGDNAFTEREETFLKRLVQLAASPIYNKKKAERERLHLVDLERTVDRAVDDMNAFADGDLTVRLASERDDAVARLFRAFNRAADTLAASIAHVGRAAEDAAAAAAQIGASTDELAAGAHQQSAQAEEVAAAVEEMVHTITDTSANATRMAEAATRNGEAAREGSVVVEETVQKIRAIADVVGESAVTVERLGASSEQVGAIVTTIEDIADQTNLLALNAAIEAARAGEHGRGFAVVADEVRKLAERTTHATAEIGEMITQIRRETEEAVAAMRRGSTEVDEGIALADRAGGSLAEIVGGANATVDMTRQIAAASEQQSTTSEEMARSVEAISSVSAEAARGVSQIAEAAGGLGQLTEELRGLVGQFRTDVAAPATARGGGPSHTAAASGDGHGSLRPAALRPVGGCPVGHA
jgi:methyl-accepting chemotaxis protein